MLKYQGKIMFKWIRELFPICRSICGPGFNESLEYLSKKNLNLKILKFRSGSKVFDWKVPYEWHIDDAYILDDKNKKFANFKKNNLHVVNFSKPINKVFSKEEILKKIFVDKTNKTAIPYITSYYKKSWGFCMSVNQAKQLRGKKFRAVIKSKFIKGYLKIGELLIRGQKKKEVFFSTYLCHPSMANNELSGPVVQTALINWVKKNYSNTNYSYRFVFLPETIGSISYLSKKLKILKKNVIAGFNLTCLGDRGAYTLIKSKNENTLSDKALKACLFKKKKFREYSFIKNGSDERQYCSPGVDLPVATFCRSKFGDYKEYHTSLDNLKFVSEKGLEESLKILVTIIICFEEFLYPKTKLICEPFLSKYGLYKSMTSKYDYKNIQDLLNAINYADGKRTIFDISLLIKVELNDLIKIYRELRFKKIIY